MNRYTNVAGAALQKLSFGAYKKVLLVKIKILELHDIVWASSTDSK